MTDTYTEVADYIASRVTLLDYGAWFVKLTLDDRETTELLTYDKDDGFVWDNDWYEGEHDVKVIDFVDANDVDPSMRWHSIAKDGLPPDEEIVIVTRLYKGGVPEIEDGFKYVRDVSKHVDMRTAMGKTFVENHKDGVWMSWHSDGFWEYEFNEYCEVLAWMPYPEPYEGD